MHLQNKQLSAQSVTTLWDDWGEHRARGEATEGPSLRGDIVRIGLGSDSTLLSIWTRHGALGHPTDQHTTGINHGLRNSPVRPDFTYYTLGLTTCQYTIF